MGYSLELRMTCNRAAQMAPHVATDLDRCRRGRRESEVREKCGHLVQPMERLTEPRRKGFELGLWQVTELFLDPAQFGNDHGRTGHSSVVAMLPGAEREPPL